MRYGPWPRRGRLLRHLCFASSFLRCFTPGGCHPAVAVLLVSAARPGLDPGTLRHYIAKPFKEGGQTAEGQWQAAQPRTRWQSDFLVRTPRMALRRRHTEPA